MTARWPQIRAALIAVHVLAITLAALPAPVGGMNRKAWSEPTVQEEFASWTARLNGAGLDLTQAELEDQLWTVAVVVMDVRGTVLAPFRPYYQLCGTTQPWRMFVAPHRFPSRLQVRVREGRGPWKVVYQVRSDEHDWNRAQLDTDRVRSAVFRYGWPTYGATYQHFARWLADRAFEDFPDASQVEIRFLDHRTPSPAEVLADAPVKFKPRASRKFRRTE